MKTVANFLKLWKHLFVDYVNQKDRYVSLLTIGLLCTVLMAACDGNPLSSGNSAQPAVEQPSVEQPAPNQPAVDVPAVEQPTASPPAAKDVLPGTEEFGLTKQQLVEVIENGEALIAQCMGEAGFEYIPVDYNTVRKSMVSDKSAPGLPEPRFIAKYGFGISTLYTGLPPQQADPAFSPATVGLGEQNIRIFNNLSPADQVAYNRTLFGEYATATFAVRLEVEDLSRTGGCTAAAIKQLFTEEQLSTTYLNPKDALIAQDPRMVVAMTEFADCLRDAGFDYNHEWEVEPDIRRRLDEITGGAPVASLSTDARAALTALQKEEEAVAIVVFNCEVKYLDPAERQIERELYAGK